MHTARPRRMVALVAAGVAGALILGGCASSTDDGGESNTADRAAGLAHAQEQIAPYLERAVSMPDLEPPIPVDQPLAELPTGKKFAYVECNVPECAVVGAQMKVVIEELGGEFISFKQGTDTQSTAEAFQAAFDSRPDVLIQDAIEPQTWNAQLTQFKDAGIPVVSWTIPNDPPAEGISAVFNGGDTFRLVGRIMADYVIAESDGEANAVIFFPPEYTVFSGLAEDFVDEIQTQCPDCTVEAVSAPASEIGSQLPNRVVSYVQANPDTDWVVGAFGSVLIGVPQALAAAGIEGIDTLSQAGGQVNFQYIADGLQTADLSNDLNQEAWIAADIAAKLATGQAVDEVTINSRSAQKFITRENLDFAPEDGFASYPGYQEYFLGLWGLE
ncbi:MULTISPECIES: sugar ABC transporter substrate-binding protein [Microbacterium]|uniref:sugar ABC transporter substrate-binding protein n=1 Tax=Microbacterium TaxID=33882 RepID=UPI001D171914|nr:substrate-binding domain-containing protein [Microbacterium schleiferi]MCC4266930.1 substrate-binding domain-containing protein [Microbacterium schleiferi]